MTLVEFMPALAATIWFGMAIGTVASSKNWRKALLLAVIGLACVAVYLFVGRINSVWWK